MLELATLQYSDAASGWAGWALVHPEFGRLINPITARGQIMPTTLLLAHPDLKIQRHKVVQYVLRPSKKSLCFATTLNAMLYQCTAGLWLDQCALD